MKKLNLNKLNWEKRYSYLKNVLFTEKDLNCVGSKFQVVKFLSGESIEQHYHKRTYEIFYILEGRGIVTMNGKDYLVGPNNMFLCEPKDKHGFNNTGSKDLIVLIFKTNEPKDDIYW